jgi:hypothetical protein
MLFLARGQSLKKGTARPQVRKGRSTTKCAPVHEETRQTEKTPEQTPKQTPEKTPAIDDAAWMKRLQVVQAELRIPKARGPRVGDVHPYVRKQIKKVLPALCETFLGKAKEGDVSTMKLLWQMAELDKQTEPAGDGAKDKTFVRQSLAKYRKR